MHKSLFNEAIKRAGAKTVLYMTWARQNAPETQQTIAQIKAKLAGLDAQYAERYRAWLEEQRLTAQNKEELHGTLMIVSNLACSRRHLLLDDREFGLAE